MLPAKSRDKAREVVQQHSLVAVGEVPEKDRGE
jgi:hypothetical protein